MMADECEYKWMTSRMVFEYMRSLYPTETTEQVHALADRAMANAPVRTDMQPGTRLYEIEVAVDSQRTWANSS